MSGMSNLWILFPGLGLAIGGVMAFSANSAIAQITPDGTLPTSSQVTTQGNIININGGTKSGSNLFHSFDQFSVPDGITAHFQNAADIQNIFSRVTGKSISNIQGTLKADGAANLFLINPNGIVFGPNASLQIGGSFIGSTASSVNFDDGTKFSAINPQTTPLLTVSVPIGLQFGATAASISNKSQAEVLDPITMQPRVVGLQVNSGQTLALVGGDITLEGGNLTAVSGRIELGSVAGNSLVSLNLTNLDLSLGYEGVQNFQDIRLIQGTVDGVVMPSYVDTTGKDGGNIHVQGKYLLLTDGSAILTNALGLQPGGNLTVTTSDSVELIGLGTSLRAVSLDAGNTGGLMITTRKLIVRDGAQIFTRNDNSASEVKLTINASDSVEFIGGGLTNSGIFVPTALLSATSSAGNAGSITINTAKLRIQDGARVSTESAGRRLSQNRFRPATGQGGNLTVNASKSVELIGTSANNSAASGLFTSTQGSGSAGNLTLTTGQLIVRDGAKITVSSAVPKNVIYLGDASKLGPAGDINITARAVLLDTSGKLTAEAEAGKGGNINLQVQNTLLMRRNSGISTSAGTSGAGGDGGNITINAPKGFIVATALGNNDITANAFSGAGGKITINAKSVFGFVPRSRADLVKLLGTEDPNKLNPQNVPTSDITAFSQQNPSLNGVIQINTPDIDPKKLAELPENLIDTAGQIAAACGAGGKLAGGSFTAIGRGGVVADPTDVLTAEAVLTDWISLSGEGENRAGGVRNNAGLQKQGNTVAISQKDHVVNSPEQIVEAQGWVIDARGNVVLVAQAPTATPHSPGLKQADCAVR